MESISIQIPAALYVSIFEQYGEETSATVIGYLRQLVANQAPAEAAADSINPQYARPGFGTKTGRVWEVADRILKETGAASREAVTKACMHEGININTASTQYSYWRKANP